MKLGNEGNHEKKKEKEGERKEREREEKFERIEGSKARPIDYL